MIFLRYEGGAPEGSFTTGRVYIGKNDLDAEAQSHDRFGVRDDNNDRYKYRFKDNFFSELEFIYGVWVSDGDSFELGEVLMLDEADGDSYDVSGYGYFNQSGFEVLDGTNLRPGIMACDSETGRWVKVMRVDGKFNLSTEDNPDRYRQPNDFKFAVVDGAITDFPMVYCIDPGGDSLTEDKHYRLIASENDFVIVKNDDGVEKEYSMAKFSVEKVKK